MCVKVSTLPLPKNISSVFFVLFCFRVGGFFRLVGFVSFCSVFLFALNIWILQKIGQ